MILSRIASVVQLLALSSSYTEPGGTNHARTFLETLLSPKDIRIGFHDSSRLRGIIPDMPESMLGDLLVRSEGDAFKGWATIQMLVMQGYFKIGRRPDKTYEFAATQPISAVQSALVAFPLAEYPFFNDPYRPLAHAADYFRQYFPDVKIGGDFTSAEAAFLEAESDGERTLWWTDHGSLVGWMRSPLRHLAFMVNPVKGEALLLRRSGAGDRETQVEETLAGVSCVDSGAVKRCWQKGDSTWHVIGSCRKLAADEQVLGLLSEETFGQEEAVKITALLTPAGERT